MTTSTVAVEWNWISDRAEACTTRCGGAMVLQAQEVGHGFLQLRTAGSQGTHQVGPA